MQLTYNIGRHAGMVDFLGMAVKLPTGTEQVSTAYVCPTGIFSLYELTHVPHVTRTLPLSAALGL